MITKIKNRVRWLEQEIANIQNLIAENVLSDKEKATLDATISTTLSEVEFLNNILISCKQKIVSIYSVGA